MRRGALAAASQLLQQIPVNLAVAKLWAVVVLALVLPCWPQTCGAGTVLGAGCD